MLNIFSLTFTELSKKATNKQLKYVQVFYKELTIQI